MVCTEIKLCDFLEPQERLAADYAGNVRSATAFEHAVPALRYSNALTLWAKDNAFVLVTQTVLLTSGSLLRYMQDLSKQQCAEHIIQPF